MARGWESKDVESQQEQLRQARESAPARVRNARVAEQRRVLQLARARASADFARAVAPAHREMLTQALAAIDAQLQALPDEHKAGL